MHETAKPCAKNPDLPSQCVQRVLPGVGNEEGLFFTCTGTSLVQKVQKPALWAEKLWSDDLTARKVSVVFIPAAESLPGQGTGKLEQRFLCSSSSAAAAAAAAPAAAEAAAAAAVTAVFFAAAAAAAAVSAVFFAASAAVLSDPCLHRESDHGPAWRESSEPSDRAMPSLARIL